MAESPGDGSFFTLFDMLILSAACGLALYWFFMRVRKQEEPSFKKLSVMPNLEQRNAIGFLQKMKNQGRKMIVFYGSQTGTAEEFATRLTKGAFRYGMKSMVADPEEYEMDELSKMNEIENGLAVFCMASYGEGDPTDNAQNFSDWLKDGESDLSGLNYAVFGLGNKTYEHYNAMGKYVDTRLHELGGNRICEVGLGDDDTNIEEDFVTWCEQFWPVVCSEFGVCETGEEISIRQYALIVHDADDVAAKTYTGEIGRVGSFQNQKIPYDVRNPYLAPVSVNRELHKGGNRSCMHIELDIIGSKIRYEAGDHVGIYPANDIEIVNSIGERLGIDLDIVISLKNVDDDSSKMYPFPCPCSYRTALTYYVDIQTPLRTHVLKELVTYACDIEEKDKLLKMTSSDKKGKELYLSWILNDHRNILSVLEDMPSLNPPLDHLLELLPRLQARLYSISSSPKVHPETVCITAVVVQYAAPTGRQISGVATSWLQTKNPNNGHSCKIPMYIRKSQFRIPYNPSSPVIMIGPGTGLAPFRGFIQERDFLRQQGKLVSDTVLYFGCRRKTEDFIYEEELSEFVHNGSLTRLYTAFSRDQLHKVYVQHLLAENSSESWNILENNGYIYVCGDARNMAKDVVATLERIVMEEGCMSKEKAESYIRKLQNLGRYSVDVWT